MRAARNIDGDIGPRRTMPVGNVPGGRRGLWPGTGNRRRRRGRPGWWMYPSCGLRCEERPASRESWLKGTLETQGRAVAGARSAMRRRRFQAAVRQARGCRFRCKSPPIFGLCAEHSRAGGSPTSMPATLPDLPATPAALERPDVRRPTIDGDLAPGQITPGRIASIDILRGFTILLMIFVNDIAGVAGLPGWMKHYQPPDGDGMTFVDVIFPAFLFIVGMSIPFALRRRLAEVGSMGRVWGHILARTAALLIIGVFMVNSDGYADEAALSSPVWTLMMYAGVILVWSHWPRTRHLSPPIRRGMMGAGIILLIASAILFRGPGEPAFIELRPQWWGILGLIGWAYLVGCATYLIVRTNVTAIVGVMVLLYGLYFADGAGALDGIPIITDWISIGSMLGSHGALTVSGLALGVILLPDSPIRSHAARIRWAVTYAVMMA